VDPSLAMASQRQQHSTMLCVSAASAATAPVPLSTAGLAPGTAAATRLAAGGRASTAAHTTWLTVLHSAWVWGLCWAARVSGIVFNGSVALTSGKVRMPVAAATTDSCDILDAAVP